MTADFIEYLVVAMIGEAAAGWPPDLFMRHHDDLARLADREFELLDRIDPERRWLAQVDTVGTAIEAAEEWLATLDRVAYGFDREWC